MSLRNALPLLTSAILIGMGLAAGQAQQAGMTFFVSSVGSGKGDQLKASGGAGLIYCFAAN